MKLHQMIEHYKLTPDPQGIKKAKTPEARATYAFVFEPRETPSGEMKFQICLIFPKDTNLKSVCQSIVNAAAAKFGADHSKWPKNLKSPIRDGDEERDGKEYENAWFMNAGNKNQPGIVDLQMQPIMSSDEFFSGCYCRASLNFYGYDQSGNKGVGTGLNNILKTKVGERLDGQTSAEEDFKEYAVEDDEAVDF